MFEQAFKSFEDVLTCFFTATLNLQLLRQKYGARNYAEKLATPYAYSANTQGFYGIQMSQGKKKGRGLSLPRGTSGWINK